MSGIEKKAAGDIVRIQCGGEIGDIKIYLL